MNLDDLQRERESLERQVADLNAMELERDRIKSLKNTLFLAKRKNTILGRLIAGLKKWAANRAAHQEVKENAKTKVL